MIIINIVDSACRIVLYELMSGSTPYENIPTAAMMRQVVAGRRPLIGHLTCPETIKTVMDACWQANPHYRPSCHEITKELQKKDVNKNT